MADHTTLSVRGEARRTVAPDSVVLRIGLRAVPGPRAEVLAWLRTAQQAVIATLTGLGGAPLTVDTDGAGLTWSFGSIGIHDEHDVDEATGRHGPTGRVEAQTSAVVVLRRLDRLAALGEALGAVEHLGIDDVSWRVDPDNAAWPVVRADAVGAALAKARDYAAALGGSVVSVEHVADAGLLSGARESGDRWIEHSAMAVSAVLGDGDGVPTLDPVPQEIRAVIEARVVADIAPPGPA